MRNELARRYAGKEVTVLDASELQRDGASTMVVTFQYHSILIRNLMMLSVLLILKR